ncbi:hypothetical protein T484DRAFT_2388400 [Baffinella frigidus]|nr:hypothetical protein T484DRAFT_2388400 [Cryptophyta sp. CCMP2293]
MAIHGGEEAGGELRGEEQLGRRQRQIEELDALEAMFGVDEGVFSVEDPEARDLVRGVVESCGSNGAAFCDALPLLGCRIEIAPGASEDSEVAHRVTLSFPRGYPDKPATSRVLWPHGTRAENECLNSALQHLADSLAGEEAGLQAIQYATQVVGEAFAEKSEAGAAAATPPPPASPLDNTLGRRMIYFHHIINENKRALVRDWAAQLRLGGYSKIGWPGLVVIEGSEVACQEYVRGLQRLKWQHMAVHPTP